MDRRCADLAVRLLSPASSSAVSRAPAGSSDALTVPSSAMLSEKKLEKFFKSNVEGFSKLKYRQSSKSIAKFISMTYKDGMEQFKEANPGLCEHTKQALRFVLYRLGPSHPTPVSDAERKQQLTKLSEAYTGCQAEQTRVIDMLYGQLSGRERTLRDQALALLDRQKDIVLEFVSMQIEPQLMATVAGPHIQNQHRMDIGETLGLPGIEAAKLDRHSRNPLTSEGKVKAVALFKSNFSALEFVKNFTADVNQQDPMAERFVLPKTLFDWATRSAAEPGPSPFNQHSVLFDDEHPDLYDGQPAPGNEYSAYVHTAVALDILERLFP